MKTNVTELTESQLLKRAASNGRKLTDYEVAQFAEDWVRRNSKSIAFSVLLGGRYSTGSVKQFFRRALRHERESVLMREWCVANGAQFDGNRGKWVAIL